MQTQTRHPEAPPIPDSVAWQPIPIYNRAPQQPPVSPSPAAPPAKAIAAGVLVMGGLITGVGWRIHEAAYTAGAADAQAEISQLRTNAAATNARIDAFCGTP